MVLILSRFQKMTEIENMQNFLIHQNFVKLRLVKIVKEKLIYTKFLLQLVQSDKKVYETIQIFWNPEKTPANLRNFQNLWFLRGHYSKQPFAGKVFWHLFTQFISCFGIKTLLVQKKGIKTWKLAFKIHPKTLRFSEKGVLRHDFLPFLRSKFQKRIFFKKQSHFVPVEVKTLCKWVFLFLFFLTST